MSGNLAKIGYFLYTMNSFLPKRCSKVKVGGEQKSFLQISALVTGTKNGTQNCVCSNVQQCVHCLILLLNWRLYTFTLCTH